MNGWIRLLTAVFLVTALAAASPAAARVIETEVVVPASLDDVWAAWTTGAGLTSFFAPVANVELEIGGAYEVLFLLDAPAGSRGGEGLKILDHEAPHRLVFQWNAPPTFPNVRRERTWVEIDFSEAGPGEVRVHLVQGGWGEGEEWDQVYDYFGKAWPSVLANLKKRFENGPIDWGERVILPEKRAALLADLAPPPPGDGPVPAWVIRLEPIRPDLPEGPTPEESAIIEAHFERLQRLQQEGTLLLAGPTAAPPYFGLVVIEAADEATARAILEGDPAIRHGIMTGTLHPFHLALFSGR